MADNLTQRLVNCFRARQFEHGGAEGGEDRAEPRPGAVRRLQQSPPRQDPGSDGAGPVNREYRLEGNRSRAGGIVEVGLQTAPDLLNYLPKVDVLGN